MPQEDIVHRKDPTLASIFHRSNLVHPTVFDDFLCPTFSMSRRSCNLINFYLKCCFFFCCYLFFVIVVELPAGNQAEFFVPVAV